MHTMTFPDPLRQWFSALIGQLFCATTSFVANAAFVLKHKKRWLYVVALTAICFSAISMAQTDVSDMGPTPTVEDSKVNSLPFTGPQLANQIGNSVDTALKKLADPNTLGGYKDALVYFGLALGMIWSSVRIMASSKGLGELFAEWVPLFVAFGVIYVLLDKEGAQSIISTMDGIAGKIANQDVSSAAKILSSTMEKTFKSINSIIEMPQATKSQGWLDALTVGAMQTVVVFMLKAATIFIITIAACVYLAMALMAMISVALVMGLAPVMVPFLIFKPLAWIFESWLKFLLGACMIKLVGAFMLSLTSGMLDQMTILASSVASQSSSATAETFMTDLLIYAVIILISVLAALLMSQTTSIATGLLQGSAGGAGFSGLKAASQNMGARAATGGGSAAGAGVKAGGTQTIGRSIAARKGASDATSGISASAQRYSSSAMNRAYQVSHQKNSPKKVASGAKSFSDAG